MFIVLRGTTFICTLTFRNYSGSVWTKSICRTFKISPHMYMYVPDLSQSNRSFATFQLELARPWPGYAADTPLRTASVCHPTKRVHRAINKYGKNEVGHIVTKHGFEVLCSHLDCQKTESIDWNLKYSILPEFQIQRVPKTTVETCRRTEEDLHKGMLNRVLYLTAKRKTLGDITLYII